LPPPSAESLWLSVEWMFLFFPEAQPQGKEKKQAARKGRAFPHCAAAEPQKAQHQEKKKKVDRRG